MKNRRLCMLFVAIEVLSTAIALIVLWRCSVASRIAARESFYRSLGIYEPGTAEFVPLPQETPHRSSAADLGNALFNDRRIVRNKKRTCGTCHPPFIGGTDDKLHDGILTRSTHNAVFASFHLHDGRLKSLKEVVEHMISDPARGNLPLHFTAERLGEDANMVKRFEKCYKTGLVASNVVDALVERIRARTTQPGVFDLHLSGRKNVLKAEQERGFEVFKTAKCASCHSGPALGGRTVTNGRKTATLRGMSRRKLFLHDGSATTPAEALAKMPRADKLSPENTSALLSFLGIL